MSCFRFVQALLVAGLVLSGAAGAFAQTTATDKADAGPAWAYGCQQDGEAKGKSCRIMQNLTIKQGDTQQRLLTIIVRPQGDAKNHALLVALPHGLFLPAGVTLKVDDKAPVKMVIQTSDAQGAYAGAAISDELLQDLKQGQTLVVSFLTAARKPVSVPVTLSGFTAAYAKLGAN